MLHTARTTSRVLTSTSTPLRRAFITSPIIRSSSPKDIKVNAPENRPQVPRSRTTSQLPVFPLIAIFVAGSLSFYYLAKSRQGQGSSHYVLPERDPRGQKKLKQYEE